MAPAPHAHVLDELKHLVRSRGLRATSARIAVLRQLHDRGAPMTHDEVMCAVGQGTIDKATVYRILADLTRAELLVRMDLGDRIWRYELRDPCRKVEDEHPHFLCDDCGKVVCLPGFEIRTDKGSLPPSLHGAQITVRASGRCGACAS